MLRYVEAITPFTQVHWTWHCLDIVHCEILQVFDLSIFPCRRGYATERQKGLLIVEKLDYIQSKLLRGIFFIISKRLGKLGTWINEVILFSETFV